MALDVNILKNAILTLINELKSYDGSQGQTAEDASQKFANDLAQAITDYIISADISVEVTDTNGNTLTGNGTIS